LAGDIRANENVALTAMQTLWVREHNRIADQIAAEDPSLSDEAIYQRARAIVTAEIQAITYNEFLPVLLGPQAIRPYHGYDPSVNPGIANIFSTAAYRFGHSMLPSELLRLNDDGSVIEAGNLSLRSAFFAPQELVDQGIDSVLLGAASQESQEIDTQIVDDVRNFLFGPPGAGGFDLASLNIQRGRDHGLPDYNQTRSDLGLEPVSRFADITSDPEVQAALEQVYGDVDNIDVWVGGLAEDHVPGSSVGKLLQTVLVDQFERIRDGDRFWYQNVFGGEQLRDLEHTRLADVIQRNTDIEGMQRNAFFAADTQPVPPEQTRPGRPGADHARPHAHRHEHPIVQEPTEQEATLPIRPGGGGSRPGDIDARDEGLISRDQAPRQQRRSGRSDPRGGSEVLREELEGRLLKGDSEAHDAFFADLGVPPL